MSSYIEGLHIRDLSLLGEHSEVTHPPVAEEEKDAVAWVASYHRSDWDEAFLPLSADRSSSLRSAMRHPFPSPPKSDMDTINHLPTKIVWQILGPLDNGSLLSFRQVNRRARQMVTAMPSYRLIADYAIDAVIGLHEPGLAFKFTPGDIEAALSVSTCQTRRCTQFAGYVHLPNLARYCFHCAYKCMCSCWKLRWPADVSRSIPYTCHSRRALQPPDRTCRVCDTKTAPGMRTDLDYCPLDLAPMPHVDFSRAIDNTSGEAAPARRYRDDHGVCCTGCYVRGAWMLTFQGRRVFGWRAVSSDMTRERFYSRESFLTHFRSCREAQELWEASRHGTAPVKFDREDWKWFREHGEPCGNALYKLRVPWSRANKSKMHGAVGPVMRELGHLRPTGHLGGWIALDRWNKCQVFYSRENMKHTTKNHEKACESRITPQ